jgi:aminopeptidase
MILNKFLQSCRWHLAHKSLVLLVQTAIDYSLSIQKGDHLIIDSALGEGNFTQLVKDYAKTKGAKVDFAVEDTQETRDLIGRNDHNELKSKYRSICDLVENGSAHIITNEVSYRNFLALGYKNVIDFHRSVIDPLAMMISSKSKRWLVVTYPSKVGAYSANMSLSKYRKLICSALNVDWSEMKYRMDKIKHILDDARDMHVIVPDKTDFHVSLEGRGGHISDGHFNLPDGELFYGPVEDSAQGTIYIYYTRNEGNVFQGLSLDFRDGKVVDFQTKENTSYMEEFLSKKGCSFLGEFGIGCNNNITELIHSRHIDEKMAGTIHFALGRSLQYSLSNGGGKNQAEDHWDLICDMRKSRYYPGGEIYVNGKLACKHGNWII